MKKMDQTKPLQMEDSKYGHWCSELGRKGSLIWKKEVETKAGY